MNLHSVVKQKIFQDHLYYVFDGVDGIGKTTQINLLENYFKNKGYTVFRTRSIGGSENSDCSKLRDFIVNNNFSKETEETLLSTSAWLNIQGVVDKITEHAYPHKSSKPIVILQDRGVLSHVCYGQSRGIARTTLLEIHSKNIIAASLLRATNIVLMPLNIDVILKRVKERGDTEIFHQKYEKEEFQLKVLDRMIIEFNRRGNQGIKSFADFKIIKVDSPDQPLDIHERVLECLNLK